MRQRDNIDWHAQRPGSSADILFPVAGEALQAFWAILRGEIRSSRWLHYEKEAGIRPVWEDWRSEDEDGCSVCVAQSGLGDLSDGGN